MLNLLKKKIKKGFYFCHAAEYQITPSCPEQYCAELHCPDYKMCFPGVHPADPRQTYLSE